MALNDAKVPKGNNLQFSWKSDGISLLQFSERPCLQCNVKDVLNIAQQLLLKTSTTESLCSTGEKLNFQISLYASYTFQHHSHGKVKRVFFVSNRNCLENITSVSSILVQYA